MDHSVGFYFPLALTVAGTLLYHVAQKNMPGGVSPFAPLAAAFAIATLSCLLLMVFTKQNVRTLFSWQDLNWSSLALGIAVVMIETGYLVAYRVGWKLNRAALTSNVVVAILLIPLGAILFQEHVSFRMAAGASLCIAGLILLVR